MSSKKRKNPADNAQAAASPVSAVAARRRLAEPVAIEDDAEEAVSHSLTPSNAFSALRGLRRSGNSSPTSRSKQSTTSLSQVAGEGPPSTGQTKTRTKHDDVTPKDPTSKSVFQYSSFVLSQRNSKTLPEGGLELRLQDGERFMVAGTFGIKVLTGHITIQGANFRAGNGIHWVHASHVHAIPVIRTHQETRLQLLSDEKSQGLRLMGRLSPFYSQLWRRGIDDPSNPQTGRTFDMLLSSEDTPKRGCIQELVSPPIWNRKLAAMIPLASETLGFSVLICGPKSSGKSTMSRLLTNRLLTRSGLQLAGGRVSDANAVAVLDIDPGQPEYGPPGTLSLVKVKAPNLGSPFSHPGISDESYTVLRSHALASVTPASNSGLYRQCTVALYATYMQELPRCPLIVNTPGWIQGTGLELLTDLIRHIDPHEVLYMSEDGPAESVDALREATNRDFTTLPSQPSELTFRTAAELREMQAMSYFHIRQSDGRVHWVDQPLSHLKPSVLAYSGQNRISGVLCYDYQAPSSLLFDSINGMVLALVGIENPAAFGKLLSDRDSKLPQVEETPEGIPYISNPNDAALDPQYSKLLGLVLIRGIDTEKRCLLGLSPMLSGNMDAMNAYAGDIVLVHGNFGCPNWAYTESLYYSQFEEDPTGPEVTPDRDSQDASSVPWVEILEGNQSRPVGSRRWRVRRDLGRGG